MRNRTTHNDNSILGRTNNAGQKDMYEKCANKVYEKVRPSTILQAFFKII